jgi:sRNA-binding carbon storage regulator CsrA
MLALTRREREFVTLIDVETKKKIKIFVREIRGKQVVLEFDADRTIRIWRNELLDKVTQEQLDEPCE